ncbi:response regulator [Photobacterium sp.]|uniref:response regulator n=1 Tax=Photobacterium sp. TaxID=660 RepID=UPI00299DA104|nr:response regulator [Photobacterium sp.]MDX1304416.1 response regulator [Photobacterium sp.]
MLKVLIVEDDKDIAALNSYFVNKDSRFKVLGVAGNLAEAREFVEAVVPDLVIVDNYLPDGLGVELVLELLNRPNYPECILITAANDSETVQKAHRYGAFDYLVKPLDYSRLSESLGRLWDLKHHVKSSKHFRQNELDRLFNASKSPIKSNASTDAYTLKQIIEHFGHAHIEHTSNSIAAEFGISKSTARRYLDKAVEDGDLIAFLAHGKVGRPTRVYRRPFLEEAVKM